MQHAGHTDPTRERRHGCRCRSRCRRRCRSSRREATRLAFMWPDTHLGHMNHDTRTFNHEPRTTSHEGRHTTHDRSGRARRAAIAISVSFPGPRAGSCARARNKLGTRIHEAYRISEPQFLSSSTHFTMSWGGIDGAGLASVPPTCMVAERHRTRGVRLSKRDARSSSLRRCVPWRVSSAPDSRAALSLRCSLALAPRPGAESKENLSLSLRLSLEELDSATRPLVPRS